MNDATIAKKGPCSADVEAGKSYYWCACGKSATQPFCDGSHAGTAFVPVRFDATETKTVCFCGCKRSTKAPLCDGAHRQL
jgi:CDGSH-type Zn-finger protein